MSGSTRPEVGQPRSSQIHIDRHYINRIWSMDKTPPSDIDFSMNGRRLKLLRSESEEGKPESGDPLTSPAENSPTPRDPYPWSSQL
ncbi:GL18120 [Drosophila persimilis]|uniref:GL18120 n=1 Tax=Drosophila persimilis TaxID=7234 RepID=B4HC20_DROPE|nr:GL18120 [Drosophila persimilis]